MTDSERVAALLEEATETHHRVYRITDGVARHGAGRSGG